MSRNATLRVLRVAYSAWMAVWVPIVLWAYGPQNFLWLCNIGLFAVLYCLWCGNRLLLSSQAGTLCLVGLVWTLDFGVALFTGGATATVTTYMFNAELPLLARLASLYHVFVPPLVIAWLVNEGYDRRGPWLQCAIGAAALIASAALTEPRRNVNWLVSPFGIELTWIGPSEWVALMVVVYPLVLYWPGHLLVSWIVRSFRGAAGA